MEGGERRPTAHKRKPLSDRTNNTLSLNRNSTAARQPLQPDTNKENINSNKHQLIDTTTSFETPKKRRRKSSHPTTHQDANKENVDDTNNVTIFADSTPSVRQPLSPLDEPLTVYARRQTVKSKGKEKVVNEAFTCLPVERKRNEYNKASFVKVSKCLTDLPKKRRIKERVVSKDYIEQQRAYFAEIDKCELPEEEVSESELSDH